MELWKKIVIQFNIKVKKILNTRKKYNRNDDVLFITLNKSKKLKKKILKENYLKLNL